MTPRERLLTAISNGKPDRVPGQVHGWMGYYLTNYPGCCDQFEAYERFGLDMLIYGGPRMDFDERDLVNWQVERRGLGHRAPHQDPPGLRSVRQMLPHPSGVDGTPIRDVLDRLGDRGFVRGGLGNLSSNKAMA